MPYKIPGSLLYNMSKVKNQDIRTAQLTSFCCIYRQLWADFAHCSSVFVLNFEQVTPATYNLLLFSSSFRVNAPVKFVNVILSFGCMVLLL